MFFLVSINVCEYIRWIRGHPTCGASFAEYTRVRVTRCVCSYWCCFVCASIERWVRAREEYVIDIMTASQPLNVSNGHPHVFHVDRSSNAKGIAATRYCWVRALGANELFIIQLLANSAMLDVQKYTSSSASNEACVIETRWWNGWNCGSTCCVVFQFFRRLLTEMCCFHFFLLYPVGSDALMPSILIGSARMNADGSAHTCYVFVLDVIFSIQHIFIVLFYMYIWRSTSILALNSAMDSHPFLFLRWFDKNKNS